MRSEFEAAAAAAREHLMRRAEARLPADSFHFAHFDRPEFMLRLTPPNEDEYCSLDIGMYNRDVSIAVTAEGWSLDWEYNEVPDGDALAYLDRWFTSVVEGSIVLLSRTVPLGLWTRQERALVDASSSTVLMLVSAADDFDPTHAAVERQYRPYPHP